MLGTSACASNMGARKFTLIVVSQFFSVILRIGSFSATPALLTSTSMVPKAFNASAAAKCGPSTVLMSASTVKHLRPAFLISVLISSRPALSRPTATISAPASASTLQASKPMPFVAPVTRMRLPLSPCLSCQLLMTCSCSLTKFQHLQRLFDKHSVPCAGSIPGHPADWHPSRQSTLQTSCHSLSQATIVAPMHN